MHLVYLDDSHDQDTRVTTFSAVAIPATRWAETFDAIRSWRQELRDSDGIFITKELHATDFVAGRGRIAPKIVPKGRRCQIFRDGLATFAGLPDVQVFNAARRGAQWGFERLLNRLNRTMQAWDSHVLLICDEGKEAEYTRLVRKMSVYNPIPSRFGVWRDTEQNFKNIPIDRILEDPFFKESDKSYFVQMADWCAFALLRRECPIPSRTKYGVDQAFDALDPICVRATNPNDPLGIVR